MTTYRWSPASAVYQIAHGTDADKTQSAIGWLNAQIREDRQETDYRTQDLAARLLTALAEVREMPADLGSALATATKAADRFAAGWDIDTGSPDGDKHASEQWLGAALDMSNAIPALRAAMPAGWQG